MRTNIKLGNRLIGDDQPCFIIAEAGSNHDGKLDQAKRLVDIAANSGVDAVKFQLFKAEILCPDANQKTIEAVKKCEFPRLWLADLHDHALKRGVVFLASPFDIEAVNLLCDINVEAFKVASSEVVNLPLLRYIAAKNKPVFLSTGMSSLADVEEALEAIYSTGNEQVVLLQCTALYPTQPSQANLRAMDTLRDSFHRPVGFSDHTLGILIPSLAAARGACVIEKHFTVDRDFSGPDHAYAIEPDELAQMVKDVHTVQESLGTPIKRMLEEEKKLARRKSLFARKDIPKDSEILEEMIEARTPAWGLEPRALTALLGRRTMRDIKKGEPILWKDCKI